MPPLESSTPKRNPIALVAVFVILLVLAFIMFGKNKDDVTNPSENNSTNVTKENVVMTKAEAGKVPTGFPSSIPVESNNIILADTKVYTDRATPVTLYTVNYTSSKTVAEKYNEYLSFMTKEGYVFAENGKDEKNHALYGMNGGNSLLVSISADIANSGKTTVQIAYNAVN